MAFPKNRIGVVGMVAMMFVTLGCASTRVTFKGPPGAVMFVDEKAYHLPASIELQHPSNVGLSKRYDVSLVFTTQQQKELRAKGYIDVFGYNETDMDKLSINTCDLDEAQLVKILDGAVVVFKGQSASRQPIYDLTLGKQ